MKKTLLTTAVLIALSSCTGSGTVGTSLTYEYFTSPNITATQFVNSLNDVDGAPSFDESELVLGTDETLRSGDDWFVIWDADAQDYKAVSLQYIRSITYYDYVRTNFGTADEFRNIEADDILNGDFFGDSLGLDYETVDFIGNDSLGVPLFEGVNTGLLYEDQVQSFDVSLAAGEADMMKKAQKASNLSFAYNLDIKTSLALVSLGEKVENKLGAGSGELTLQDQVELMGDITHLTGVTMNDLEGIATGSQNKSATIEKAAKKIGTSSSSLQQRLLPEVFGISL